MRNMKATEIDPVSQCTFWCSVLSDLKSWTERPKPQVSMHLLVLSAFRLVRGGAFGPFPPKSLNAPSGAQCFPTHKHLTRHPPFLRSQCTFWCSVLSDTKNLPLGDLRTRSQCTFWCSVLSDLNDGPVLNEVLSASQCTFWCSVLSDVSGVFAGKELLSWSQCTFWCSVLSDARRRRK